MDVKRLWGTLRSSYTRSVKNSLDLGSTLQKRTPWYLEDEMTFLRPHLQLVMPGGKRLSLSPRPDYKDIGLNLVKVEESSMVQTGSGRGELEEGEILPEDLISGAYWLTPQFPDRFPSSKQQIITENHNQESPPSSVTNPHFQGRKS